MARWNNPLPCGEPTMADTSIDPADSPSMVTRLGSPPKLAMFFCTQRSTLAISIIP